MEVGQFCPECGSGIESTGSDGVIFRAPKGFPFKGECKTCMERSTERFRELGRQVAEKMEREFLRAITGEYDRKRESDERKKGDSMTSDEFDKLNIGDVVCGPDCVAFAVEKHNGDSVQVRRGDKTVLLRENNSWDVMDKVPVHCPRCEYPGPQRHGKLSEPGDAKPFWAWRVKALLEAYWALQGCPAAQGKVGEAIDLFAVEVGRAEIAKRFDIGFLAE